MTVLTNLERELGGEAEPGSPGPFSPTWSLWAGEERISTTVYSAGKVALKLLSC